MGYVFIPYNIKFSSEIYDRTRSTSKAWQGGVDLGGWGQVRLTEEIRHVGSARRGRLRKLTEGWPRVYHRSAGGRPEVNWGSSWGWLKAWLSWASPQGMTRPLATSWHLVPSVSLPWISRTRIWLILERIVFVYEPPGVGLKPHGIYHYRRFFSLISDGQEILLEKKNLMAFLVIKIFIIELSLQTFWF